MKSYFKKGDHLFESELPFFLNENSKLLTLLVQYMENKIRNMVILQ